MIILIDLDGTLLNARERLYLLFKMLVPECDLSITDYWDLKRAKVTHELILSKHYGYIDKQIADFEVEWMNLIEEESWLKRDVIFAGVCEHLRILGRAADLYLVTARQRPEMVDSQLEHLGLKNIFTNILVTGGKLLKDDVVMGLPLAKDHWIIGDTGHDIEVGKRLGIRTASVTNGFLSRESLEPYRPDLMIESFTDFSIDFLN